MSYAFTIVTGENTYHTTNTRNPYPQVQFTFYLLLKNIVIYVFFCWVEWICFSLFTVLKIWEGCRSHCDVLGESGAGMIMYLLLFFHTHNGKKCTYFHKNNDNFYYVFYSIQPTVRRGYNPVCSGTWSGMKPWATPYDKRTENVIVTSLLSSVLLFMSNVK